MVAWLIGHILVALCLVYSQVFILDLLGSINKFFEYLASGRPILAVGPKQSDIGTVLSKTSAGVIVERDDFAGIKDAVLALFKEQNTARQEAEIAKFSRQGLTKELAQIIQRVAN